jgi:hypothetical protein
MSGQAPERKLAKGLGLVSFGLGVAQLAVPERINQLIGVKDTPKTRTIQRLAGVQELTAAQGIFAFSPPTPVLWSRVAGDLVHLGLLGKAHQNRRNDKAKLFRTIVAVAGIGFVDTLVSARYQSRWPKEPTPGENLPTSRDANDGQLEDAHFDGNPAITILATEAEIRPKLQQQELASYGDIEFRKAPGGRGTEVIVKTTKKTDTVKAELRKVKQLIEVGEIVVSDSTPEGADVKRQLKQRSAQPLSEKELAKTGGKS